MAQFDLHTILNQIFVTIVGYYIFHLFVTKYFLVQLKRSDSILYFIKNYRQPIYEWLRFDAFSLENPEKQIKIARFFTNFKKF
ncbi:MAG: hypothetical protein RLZZ414_1720 [Bacteroidota bacterium]|jgi:hypothetical protein